MSSCREGDRRCLRQRFPSELRRVTGLSPGSFGLNFSERSVDFSLTQGFNVEINVFFG